MRLRIIAGTLRGRFLNIPDRDAEFRPTLERTRQSVLDIIKFRLPGAIAADICAGSGAFGFEMISRGALRVDFIEKDRRRADLINKNSGILSVTDQCRCIVEDVRAFLRKHKECYQVVFYDPPYADKDLAFLVPDLLNVLAADGILVYERSSKQSYLQDLSVCDYCYDIREFGDTVVEFYAAVKNQKG